MSAYLLGPLYNMRRSETLKNIKLKCRVGYRRSTFKHMISRRYNNPQLRGGHMKILIFSVKHTQPYDNNIVGLPYESLKVNIFAITPIITKKRLGSFKMSTRYYLIKIFMSFQNSYDFIPVQF